VTAVISEAMMVACALALAPRGAVDKALAKSTAVAATAGAAMMLTAFVSRPLGALAGAALSVCVYASALYLLGAVDRRHLAAIREAIVPRTART
jgi:uncharacterized membrane protein required for colicin V production